MLGGFSVNGTTYDRSTKVLELRGWLLPRTEYDSIEVWYNNIFLGEAAIDIPRGDVIRGLPQYKGQNPGFEFKKMNFDYVDGDNAVLLLIKKEGELVDTRIGNLEISEGKSRDLVMKYAKIIQNKIDFIREKREVVILCKPDQKETFMKFSNVDIIENISDIKNSESYVIVTYEGEDYHKTAEVLFDKGLKFHTDFVPMWYIVAQLLNYSEICYWGIDVENYLELLKQERKIAILYGNCQMEKIAKGLACSKDFGGEYIAIVLPGVFEFREVDFLRLRKTLKDADLFIYQNVNMTNRYSPLLGTDYIITALKSGCKKVCIPNIYFAGYYPQTCKNEYNTKDFFPTGDININKLYKDGNLNEQALSELQDDNYYTKEFCEDWYKKCIDELKEREKNCDIHIVDYIEGNYKKQRLFYTNNHPMQCVLEELIQRLLLLLKGKRDPNYKWDSQIGNLDYIEQPIYNSVKKNLGLEFEYDLFVPNKNYSTEKVNWDSYLEMYINLCFR